MEKLHKFTYDLESAVDCFFPVLDYLQIKEDISDDPTSACLSYFEDLKEIDTINKWEIIILKADLKADFKNNDGTAKFILKYSDPELKDSILKCFIVIDKIFYTQNENCKVAHETKRIIAVHEFVHFLSVVFLRLHNPRTIFLKILTERLSEKINIYLKDTLELYKFFNEIRPIDDFNSDQTSDKHFRLEKYDPPLNYSELCRNLMLPYKLFDKHFPKEEKEEFSRLWKEQKYGDANEFYKSIARRVAQEELITEKFAIYQAFELLKNYYAYSLLK